MWKNRKKSLKASYYYSFFILIVIPIFLIILLSISVIRAMMVDSAIRGIRRAQDNIISTLGREILDISLRLSHLVYVNNNEIMEFAAGTYSEDSTERYVSMKSLTSCFNFSMAPVQDVLSADFYMNDGKYIYLKNDIILSPAEVSSSSWYQSALDQKNMVKIGFYDKGVTYSDRNSDRLIIVAALSPGPDVDRKGVVDMAVLFADSQVGNLIKQYNREKSLGSTFIVDCQRNPVFDMDGKAILITKNIEEKSAHEYYQRIDGEKYVYVFSKEPFTGLQVVSVVDSGELTKDFNRVALILLGATILLFTLFYCFSNYFLRNIIEPVHHTVEGMMLVEEGNLDVHLDPMGQAELRQMIHSFNRMTRRLKQLRQENEEHQNKKHEAEIKALQSQINPHFLVNSLSSIRFIAHVSKYEAIGKMAEALIKILSGSFRSNEGFYTLREELEILDSYIYLMKIRFSDGFEIQYDVDETCLSFLVPRLLLQPIVENSIVHGFDGLVDGIGKVQVSIYSENGFLHICIRDNGKGMTEEEIQSLFSGEFSLAKDRPADQESTEHVSMAVANINTRLQLNYGASCRFTMESEKGVYLKTDIIIPIKRKEDSI